LLSQTEKEERSAIRKRIRSERQALNITQRLLLAENCKQHFAGFELLSDANNIAIYCDSDGEVPTRSIMEFLWSSGKNVFVPVINDGEYMDFVPLNQDEDLTCGKFDISTPAQKKAPVNPETLELIIAPLVAFDEEGNRLGRGGGYYDRFMQSYGKPEKKGGYNNPAFLGLAYSFQQTLKVPHADWDRRLDAVITDRKLIRF